MKNAYITTTSTHAGIERKFEIYFDLRDSSI